jgi:Protein of unknown function (DUF3833)
MMRQTYALPNRRTFLVGATALVLSACASVPPNPAPPTLPVTLTEAFVGRATGQGLFRVWLTGDERRFTARLNGSVSKGGNRLTVVEDFVYDDGEKNRLTWVFDRSGPGTWTGKREDTVGLAQVIEADGVIRLTYTADFASPSGVTRLGFADVIYRRTDGVIINDAVVSRAGIPVGAVQFVIQPR